MKNLILSTLLLGVASLAFAQKDFNRWSLEVNGGFNKAMGPLTPGFYSPTLNFGHVDFGTRFMANEKFGVSAKLGIGTFNEASGTPEFKADYYSANFNGVMNLGRILSFETFTSRLTFLSEIGFGAGALKQASRIRSEYSPSSTPDFDPDYVYSFNSAIKLLYSISNRISLQGAITAFVNGRQRYTFDGNEFNQEGRPDAPEIPFVHATGTWWTGTLGLNFYLGKAEQHADWYIAEDKYATKAELAEAIDGIKDMLKDSDGDGVSDYLDKEPNTPTGARVSFNGMTLDSDQDGTADHLDKCPFLPGPSSTGGCPVEEITEQADYLRKAIEEGYVNVYFGFDSSKPLLYSNSSAAFVANFLQKNPGINLEVKGFADELGEENYNIKLSEKRAKAVYDLLISAGVDLSRLSYKGYGEDTSVDKSSPDARQMARRTSFEIK